MKSCMHTIRIGLLAITILLGHTLREGDGPFDLTNLITLSETPAHLEIEHPRLS